MNVHESAESLNRLHTACGLVVVVVSLLPESSFTQKFTASIAHPLAAALHHTWIFERYELRFCVGSSARSDARDPRKDMKTGIDYFGL